MSRGNGPSIWRSRELSPRCCAPQSHSRWCITQACIRMLVIAGPSASAAGLEGHLGKGLQGVPLSFRQLLPRASTAKGTRVIVICHRGPSMRCLATSGLEGLWFAAAAVMSQDTRPPCQLEVGPPTSARATLFLFKTILFRTRTL